VAASCRCAGADWARLSARQSVVDCAQLIVAPPHGEYSKCGGANPGPVCRCLRRSTCYGASARVSRPTTASSIGKTSRMAYSSRYALPHSRRRAGRAAFPLSRAHASAPQPTLERRPQTRTLAGEASAVRGQEILEHIGFRTAAPQHSPGGHAIARGAQLPLGHDGRIAGRQTR